MTYGNLLPIAIAGVVNRSVPVRHVVILIVLQNGL
jgi:hypothetical protein